jgi:hypothetical protein
MVSAGRAERQALACSMTNPACMSPAKRGKVEVRNRTFMRASSAVEVGEPRATTSSWQDYPLEKIKLCKLFTKPNREASPHLQPAPDGADRRGRE